MNLVDSSGWLEYFTDGKNARYFAPAIENTKKLMVSAINIYEIFNKILQISEENTAIQAIAVMQQGKIIEVNATIAYTAAKLSLDLKLPMINSIILATAKSNQAILWTQEVDFKDMEGVKYFERK